jgi:hypothetical protein
MSAFENYAEEAIRIEHEIARHGIALGIDWTDDVAVHALAREALSCRTGSGPNCPPHTPEGRTKLELFGLAQLMLKVMTESAGDNIETHGGPIWKAFGRALWRESGLGQEDRRVE